ncbi:MULTISPECIES: hypothetical protein [unclassified Microcystis]|uniref:hypothetical protein n=1 Tax=unclassified Microcystis TaxID=2643300 RepID=UPI00257D1AD7|nr:MULTISPECIES: hypothetical protein [unclassified Microcystis]MCA2850419.1 hypothetical protein [Microcystis sp. M076S1]MCA2863112.1 hypothetical protein [Microcystis sp. M049S1]MCA2912585.1 hypothetical protein [Microcystis sp. M022S1]MCA2928519.1 hypothetical protein [Microcystis sp. M020S1]MCA2619678.1 hypothetical protein [Microcystis sp. M099S2]
MLSDFWQDKPVYRLKSSFQIKLGEWGMGKWGSGEVGKWGSGEVGKWGSGEVGKF